MSAPLPELSGGVPLDFVELLRRHEARQTLTARAAYSLLRIAAAIPPDHRFVAAAADAGQRATVWLSGSSTNPGRWTNRTRIATELTEIDVLLADLHAHLVIVVSWVSANTGSPIGRPGPRQIRVSRTLLAECVRLINDLTVLSPAAAA